MGKYVLRTKHEEGHYLYIVSIAQLGFPITTRNIKEATEFNDWESANSAKDMIAGEFEIMEI